MPPPSGTRHFSFSSAGVFPHANPRGNLPGTFGCDHPRPTLVRLLAPALRIASRRGIRADTPSRVAHASLLTPGTRRRGTLRGSASMEHHGGYAYALTTA